MIPIMLDISPQKTFLNENWLVKAHWQKKIFTRFEFDIYDCDPQDLANKIDELARSTPQLIDIWTHDADRIAEEMSWKHLQEVYMDNFRLCMNQ